MGNVQVGNDSTVIGIFLDDKQKSWNEGCTPVEPHLNFFS